MPQIHMTAHASNARILLCKTENLANVYQASKNCEGACFGLAHATNGVNPSAQRGRPLAGFPSLSKAASSQVRGWAQENGSTRAEDQLAGLFQEYRKQRSVVKRELFPNYRETRISRCHEM
jgi:hypothetical protein